MLDKILKEYADCNFDFRTLTCPNDSLSHLFNEWVGYYKLKWAIARVIQPKSILEIGVRYGYSAFAFKDASPYALYVGIDANLPEYGGEIGAIEWAKKNLPPADTTIYEVDSQSLQTFPGDLYDLIHVDGQQDGDGFYADMVKALKQAKYILVDGALWTDENAFSSISFLKDYKDSIEWSLNLSGYAGELLIKVKQTDLSSEKVGSSQDIVELYESNYYLTDCGGFQEFKNSGGKELLDPRLSSLFLLANIKPGQYVIDAGCGRGELTYAAAQMGATVTGIDYSQSAIDIATDVLKEEIQQKKVTLKQADITTCDLGTNIDKIIAADLVEHLMPNELDRMYQRFSACLSDDGEFIVHTFPNLWFYKYGYARKRRKVRKAGGFISPEPRTHFERLMHINEQSPRVLHNQLEKHFKYVLIWFASANDMLGSLSRKFTPSDCVYARDLYAIASNTPIDVEGIKSRLTQPILSVEQRENIALNVNYYESVVNCSEQLTAIVEICNHSTEKVMSHSDKGVYLSYHWLRNGEMYFFEGERTAISVIPSGAIKKVKMAISTPNEPGEYTLQIAMVQEQVAWFEGHHETVSVVVKG